MSAKRARMLGVGTIIALAAVFSQAGAVKADDWGCGRSYYRTSYYSGGCAPVYYTPCYPRYYSSCGPSYCGPSYCGPSYYNYYDDYGPYRSVNLSFSYGHGGYYGRYYGGGYSYGGHHGGHYGGHVRRPLRVDMVAAGGGGHGHHSRGS
jgi:hypothetical protein